ncbi:hypothetical protein [Streptomyces sp. NPDC000618]|uniref:hypothetical protein n=1 Tax=Streptomyces sp. NPDC000618 TaxID=3154265 RepID=UPI00333296BF
MSGQPASPVNCSLFPGRSADCGEALQRLRGGLAPEWTAAQRDRLFEEVRADESMVDEFRFDLDRFNRGIGRFPEWLRTVGEKLDEPARPDSVGRWTGNATWPTRTAA